MKTIIINSKKYGEHEVLVDDEDYEYINKWKWHVSKGRHTFYAIRTEKISKNKEKSIKMHRLIMNLTDPNIFIDHKDRNGLNNQKDNMRSCSISENNKNRDSHLTSTTSKYIGICFHKNTTNKVWQAKISVNRKQIYLGIFETQEEAAKIYDEAAKKYNDEFANPNFK